MSTSDGEGALAQALKAAAFTISCAESCTGGLASAAITTAPGASDYFQGSVVSYSNASKERLLGVDPDIIAKHGAVSERCAEAMARGAAAVFGTDCAFSITGIAGPSGGSPEKPVGTVCFGYVVRGHAQTETMHFPGDRAAVRGASRDWALSRMAQIRSDRA